MQKKTHIAFSILTFVILTSFFDMNIFLAVFAAMGAMVPDIDWLLDKKYIPEIVKKFTWKMFFNVGIHRTLFHNVWAMVIAGYLFYYLSGMWIPTVAFVIGFASHLISDSLTVSGIHWLWPLGDNRVWRQKNYLYFRGPITTGTVTEYAFQALIYLMCGIITAKKFHIL